MHPKTRHNPVAKKLTRQQIAGRGEGRVGRRIRW